MTASELRRLLEVIKPKMDAGDLDAAAVWLLGILPVDVGGTPLDPLSTAGAARSTTMSEKKRSRAGFLVACWIVALTPTWYSLAGSPPETFWQTFSVSCLQCWLGLFALGTTGFVLIDKLAP